MTILNLYVYGAFVFFAWMSAMNRHELREAFWITLLWPVMLVALIFIAPFVCLARLGLFIRLAKPPVDLGKWGVRRSDKWARSIAIRCPFFEVQMWNAKAKKEAH